MRENMNTLKRPYHLYHQAINRRIQIHPHLILYHIEKEASSKSFNNGKNYQKEVGNKLTSGYYHLVKRMI
jgi:hypothetical protein